MSNPEFEYLGRFTSEIDWSPEDEKNPETKGLEDFSAKSLETLRSMGFITFFLDDIYLNKMLDDELIRRLQRKFIGLDFDFANLRTRKSEIAILPSVYLPGIVSKSIEEENIKLRDIEDDLSLMYGLEDVHATRGNLADNVAINEWLARHYRFPEGIPYFIRTSTNDRLSGGETDIAIQYQGLMEVGESGIYKPVCAIEPATSLDAKKQLRIGLMVVPGGPIEQIKAL